MCRCSYFADTKLPLTSEIRSFNYITLRGHLFSLIIKVSLYMALFVSIKGARFL